MQKTIVGYPIKSATNRFDMFTELEVQIQSLTVQVNVYPDGTIQIRKRRGGYEYVHNGCIRWIDWPWISFRSYEARIRRALRRATTPLILSTPEWPE